MRKLIERCPACGGELVVRRLDCHQCHTGIEGQFRTSTFDHLSPEDLAFAELFVRLKGNMKEMERELSVPYSTVRHRLDEVVRELGPPRQPLAAHPAPVDKSPTPPPAGSPTAGPSGRSSDRTDPNDTLDSAVERALRQQILEDLERGEISPDEAVMLLGGES